MEDSALAVAAVAGSEGVLGVSIFMGGTALPQATAQHSGHAWRLKSLVLKEEFLIPPGIGQGAPVRAISVPPRRINEIALGKRGVTADTALRLARDLGSSERFWMAYRRIAIWKRHASGLMRICCIGICCIGAGWQHNPSASPCGAAVPVFFPRLNS